MSHRDHHDPVQRLYGPLCCLLRRPRPRCWGDLFHVRFSDHHGVLCVSPFLSSGPLVWP